MNEPYPDEIPPGQSEGQPTWVKVFAVLIGIALVIAIIAALAYAVANNPTAPQTPQTPAFIDLTSPADGATLDASQIIVVSGLAAVKGGNLVVQALDQAGNTLTQQAVVVEGTNTAAGDPGTWIAQIAVSVPVTTAGRIRAYAVSPTDGSVSAEDSIGVTFNLATAIQPYIKIQQPAAGSALDTSAPINVTGDGAGLFEGGLVVQALDQNGAVLAQVPAAINAPQAGLGMAGQWAASLTVQGIKSGATGQIYAFSTSAVDGSVIAQDRVNVTYTAKVQPFITITSPANGAVLDPVVPFRVSGLAASLPENQVMVQVKDQNGNLLAQQPGPLDASGNWTAQLQVSASSGTPATIIAYAANPVDSSLVAQASINVLFGTAPTATNASQPTGIPASPTSPVPFPTETPPPQPTATSVPTNAPTPVPIPPQASNYLWVLTQVNNQPPVANSLVTLKFSGYTASGTSGCNTYSASVQYNGTALIFSNIATGKKTCSAPAGVMQQESAYLNALAQVKSFRLDQGQLLLLDQSGQLLLGYQAAVIGRIYGPDGAVLPAGSQVLTAITNSNTGAVLGKQPQSNYSVFPIPFAVAYNPSNVDPNQSYTIQVIITDSSGNTVFTTKQAYPVITQGNPSFVDVKVSAP
jgi:heat shock protein HslJ